MMGDFLTPISTTYTNPRLQPASSGSLNTCNAQDGRRPDAAGVAGPAEALEILKSQPDYDSLIRTLRYIVDPRNGVRLYNPDVVGSRIVVTLVNETAPNYWPLLREGSAQEDDELRGSSPNGTADLALLLTCIRNLTGINTIILQLRALAKEINSNSSGPKRPDLELNTAIYLDILSAVLSGDDTLRSIWVGTTSDPKVTPGQRQIVSREIISSFARGGLVPYAAEADVLIGNKGSALHWISDGKQYAQWLARSIASWLKRAPSEEECNFCAQVLVGAWSLGYVDELHRELFDSLLLRDGADPDTLSRFILAVNPRERVRLSYAVLGCLSTAVQERIDSSDPALHTSIVSAAITLMRRVLPEEALSKSSLIHWLIPESVRSSPESNVWMRRAVIACYSDDSRFLVNLIDKGLRLFGDNVYTGHAPMIHQQALAQIILLSSAYLRRLDNSELRIITKSSPYISMVSSRLASPSTGARFLGMVVGEAISSTVPTPAGSLRFELPEMESDEANWYKSLTTVQDEPGPVQPLLKPRLATESTATKRPATTASSKSKKSKPVTVKLEKPKLIIEEIDTDDDDDIVPYAKPDSDAEDSEEDPTLVRRDKPKAPVYIRNLIAYLRDTENYDKQKIALKTAPSLIRRKGTFGTEVSDHADELATLLVGLHDKFELEDFYELRLEGIVALLVVQPRKMGPWFIKSFFQGDYSLSQRAAILAAIGLAARELAGYGTSEHAAGTSFPSKKLSEKMEQLFLGPSGSGGNNHVPGSTLKALPPTALDDITKSMTRSFLGPMAAEAADKFTGPDALKLATFKSKTRPRPAVRVIPNTTANLIQASFFAPLVDRYRYALGASSARISTVLTEPYVLATFLKTVAVLVHAAGPSTLALDDMTEESWSAVLALRSHMVGKLPVMAAGITVLAALLEVNENRTRLLVQRMGRKITDTVDWLDRLLQITRGGEKEEDEVRMLAAGVLIRLHEIVEEHQAALMGYLI